jgi:hypothetical protein
MNGQPTSRAIKCANTEVEFNCKQTVCYENVGNDDRIPNLTGCCCIRAIVKIKLKVKDAIGRSAVLVELPLISKSISQRGSGGATIENRQNE